MAKSVGILTGGGDCPGLNAVIRAVVRRADAAGWTSSRYARAGVVSSSRPSKISGRPRCRASSRAAARSSARAARTRSSSRAASSGCAGTSSTAASTRSSRSAARTRWGSPRACTPSIGLPVVGVPKTIDNDLSGTDYTFGFDTAVSIATEAIDRLHTTAESHNRVMVVEVMGRHAGWIAVHERHRGRRRRDPRAGDPSRLRGGRRDDPEAARRAARTSRSSSSAKGCELPGLARTPAETDQFGHVLLSKRGVGDALGREHRERTGFETRVTVLGHVQRGGTPTPRDRVLATRFGLQGGRPRARRASSARWRRYGATTSSPCRSPRRPRS